MKKQPMPQEVVTKQLMIDMANRFNDGADRIVEHDLFARDINDICMDTHESLQKILQYFKSLEVKLKDSLELLK